KQQGPHALGIANQEELGNSTTAVVRDQVDCADGKPVEECRKHIDLRSRRYTLAFGNLGVPQRKKVRSDTPPVFGEAGDHAAPLEAVKRKAMQEQGDGSASALEICDSPILGLQVAPRGVEFRGAYFP